MTHTGFSRRRFFYGTLLAGAVPTGGFGSVPSLKALGYKSYNEKLNIACIGVGGRGVDDLNACASENIVALCDVDDNRAARTFARFPKLPKYKDFRRMLDKENKNIDAVTIAVPDHMHAIMALACMQRGKGVYLEKPLTRTPWESRLLTMAAQKYKVATQMGNQAYSLDSERVAAEIIWSGEIGNVTEVHGSTLAPVWPQGLQQLPPEEKVPDTLDWDLWLGCAAMRPYSSQANGGIVPWNWRAYFDFSIGPLGDWGIHVFGPANMALQLTSPISVELVEQEGKSKWTYPSRSVLRFDFPARGNMPPVSLYWHDASKPDSAHLYRPKGLENERILPAPNNLPEHRRKVATRADVPSGSYAAPLPSVPPIVPGPIGALYDAGSLFIGDKGYMACALRGESIQLLPAERWENYRLPPELLPRPPEHHLDWIRACKGGEPACSNFSVAGPYNEWLTLGAVAYHFEGKLEWDSAKWRFTNNNEANKYLRPVCRRGWEPKL